MYYDRHELEITAGLLAGFVAGTVAAAACVDITR